MINKFWLCLWFFCSSLWSSQAFSYQEDPHLAAILHQHQAVGTIVLVSDKTDQVLVTNQARAHQRLSPASTFKIANSLIALEEGVVDSPFEMIPWDGTPYAIAEWNQNQSMQSAFKYSCVWFYQILAKRIGITRYKDWLATFHYGNGEIGQDVTTFWLQKGGAVLQITPFEQIAFLKQVYHRHWPLKSTTYASLEAIMLSDQEGGYKLFSKTGAAVIDWQGHGWFVGYVVTPRDTWYFATNILMDSKEDLPKRKAITLAALKQKHIIS